MRSRRVALYGGGVLALALVAGGCGGVEAPARSEKAAAVTRMLQPQEGAVDQSGASVDTAPP